MVATETFYDRNECLSRFESLMAEHLKLYRTRHPDMSTNLALIYEDGIRWGARVILDLIDDQCT